ncbi:NAD(P)/FAD-dependent oxidoreductase [bacterium]|nr:NAD(P)/FAD-dependent oxidoreductase [bacterium]
MEHLDVVVVGAGLSGICAGHHLKETCPWARWAVLEARGAMGGTWDLFRYPGIRSDSDMYTLGYPFRPWERANAIADGPSIRRYIEETAAEDGTDRRIRFHHRVVRAEWSSRESRWHLVVERGDASGGPTTTERLTCGFLFSCTGYYRYDRGYLPEFPGLDRYRGRFVHPQFWPEDLAWAGKRVVVIGSGATAVTLVPALATEAAHVTMLQRSPTYVVSLPQRSGFREFVRRVLSPPAAGRFLRWFNAIVTQGMYRLSRRRPDLVKRALRRQVERELPEGYDVRTHFTPRYDPWDQRMCVVPDGDLFRAIREGRASVETDRIASFTEDGLRLESGRELEADVVVAATGLELLFAGGMEVVVDGEAVDPASRFTYKGMMLEGVPNFAVAIGYTNASWTLKADLTCGAVARLLNHMRDTGASSCRPVNRGTRETGEPLLGLNSGYVMRAADRFPRQGPSAPWRLQQSFLADWRAIRLGPVEDGELEFNRAAASASG